MVNWSFEPKWIFGSYPFEIVLRKKKLEAWSLELPSEAGRNLLLHSIFWRKMRCTFSHRGPSSSPLVWVMMHISNFVHILSQSMIFLSTYIYGYKEKFCIGKKYIRGNRFVQWRKWGYGCNFSNIQKYRSLLCSQFSTDLQSKSAWGICQVLVLALTGAPFILV